MRLNSKDSRQAVQSRYWNGALAVEVSQHRRAYHAGTPRDFVDSETSSRALAAEFSGYRIVEIEGGVHPATVANKNSFTQI